MDENVKKGAVVVLAVVAVAAAVFMGYKALGPETLPPPTPGSEVMDMSKAKAMEAQQNNAGKGGNPSEPDNIPGPQ